MYSNYFYGNWAYGEEENFDKEYKVKHFKEQLFTGYDIEEFERFCKWYLQFAEKRELLGATNHLLYICKKRKN